MKLYCDEKSASSAAYSIIQYDQLSMYPQKDNRLTY